MRAAWCTVLVAIRIASSPSRASIGLPLLVLRARRGKFELVTSISMRLPAWNVWQMSPRPIVT